MAVGDDEHAVGKADPADDQRRGLRTTPEVVTALNGKLTTITFDRETAPAQ